MKFEKNKKNSKLAGKMSTFTVSMVSLDRRNLKHELLYSVTALLSFVFLKKGCTR